MPKWLVGVSLLVGACSSQKEPEQDRRQLGEQSVQAAQSAPMLTDRGLALTRQGYDYAPSIMRDDDGRYRVWWCGKEEHDVIFYAESSDAASWTSPKIVLRPAGPPHGIHACDPSVVKVNGRYHMYFTSEGSPDGVGQDNSIFLATSADGVSWTHENARQPVISFNKEAKSSYGVGQSSVLFADGRFLHFFTDTSDQNDIFVAESLDGRSFRRLKGAQPVLRGVTAVDVKYIASRKQYIVAAEGPHGQWKVSFYLLDQSFEPIADAPGDGIGRSCNHNPGLLGDARGHVIDDKRIPVYFGSGTTTPNPPIDEPCWNPSSWDLGRADLDLLALFALRKELPCSSCLGPAGFAPGTSCDSACKQVGTAGGYCGAPGSTNPDNCCACSSAPAAPPDDCSKCAHNGSCTAACQAVLGNHATGRCAFPGSTNPSQCCACDG